jgi:hypothetical protein
MAFQERPFSAAFRALPGTAVTMQPLWYAYRPMFLQENPSDTAPCVRGALPPVLTAPPSLSFIPVDRGGSCYEADELRSSIGFGVKGGNIFKVVVVPAPAST